MTVAWARRFLEMITSLASLYDLDESDVEEAFGQFVLDAGIPIEFADTAELEEFRKYFTEDYLPSLSNEEVEQDA